MLTLLLLKKHRVKLNHSRYMAGYLPGTTASMQVISLAIPQKSEPKAIRRVRVKS